MRGFGVNINIDVDRSRLLGILKKNRTEHAAIVVEAKAGYLVKAQEVLAERIEVLKGGKPVDLRFELEPPRSHVKVYSQLIDMLEFSEQELITLSAEQYRHMVNDEWDWMDGFLLANSQYSGMAMEKMTRA